MSRQPTDDNAPIEEYLDALLTELRLPARATRRLLAEAEDHLYESADAGEACGISRADAVRAAVQSFGSAELVAGRARHRLSRATVAVGAAWSTLALGAAGLIAVGVSGAFAALLNVVAGRRFVGALPHTYSAASCHHFVQLHPGPGGCAMAALLENSQDAVALRLAAGFVGIACAVVAWWTRRYLSPDPSFRRMHMALTNLAAALCFGAGAAVLVGMAADTAFVHGSGGVGFYVSGALAAAIGLVLALGNGLRHARRNWLQRLTLA